MPERIRRRNPVATSPLLRKGGVHEKSVSALRQQTKSVLNQQLEEWEDDLEFERSLNKRNTKDDPAG